MFFVYQLRRKHARSAFYTGITEDVGVRWKRYCHAFKNPKRQEPVNQMIGNIGIANVKMDILADNLTKQEASKMEQHLIATQTHVTVGGTNVRRK